ncbi:MAG TPA: cation-transporting P-type ATPase [Candidatus Limnocylindria bacterium]|nr:cation-transporting P-type ATPase [Candidatus Limnocylindria bacterium]
MNEAVGLTAIEARRRLDVFGPNLLVPEHETTGLWGTLRHIASDPMAILLVVASATYFVLGETRDGIIALVALVPIVGVSLVLELRAEHALASLRRLTAPLARVIRDGREELVPALDLVPGDAIVLREGDVIPADGRLVSGTELVVDESALTGESQTITKTPLDDDEAALWAGTTVLAGRAVAVIGVTGTKTRYGTIGELVAKIAPSPTPLQLLIRRLFVQLSILAAAFCVAVFVVELVRGHSVADALIAGVSLAMAAIPEELPMVFTLYLGLGAWRLARDHALVRRLVGVETLGATGVICADKTGTLTLGTIEVAALWTAPGVAERDLLTFALLASEPEPYDPLEQAIVRAAATRGIDASRVHAAELVRDHAFDPRSRTLTHVWRRDGALAAYAKGALEGVLTHGETPSDARDRALEANADLAARGMRVIAVAASDTADEAGDRASDESRLRLAGLLAFADPLRPGVDASIAECRDAGVRVVMITGDHPITARAVAEGLGMRDARVATGTDIDAASDEELRTLVASTDVFARARPEQKYRLVRALRDDAHVVAMTGDGTNDAPALREADIGIAMGRRGTEVARSAATLVLLDDDFSTIVAAVRDGRRIFENLRRAFSYLVSFHAPLLLSAIVVPLADAPLLLLPVHLVFLELVLHPTVALVFEGDAADPELMRRPPRGRAAGLLDRSQAAGVIARGLLLTIGVLAVYLLALPAEGEAGARGLAFATMVIGQLLLVVVERADGHGVLRAGLRANRVILPILLASAGGLVIAEALPPVAALLHMRAPSLEGWLVAIAVAAVATLWGEVATLRRGGGRSAPAMM